MAEYLIDLNATAAYKRAGYKGTGSETPEPRAQRAAIASVSAPTVFGELAQLREPFRAIMG